MSEKIKIISIEKMYSSKNTSVMALETDVTKKISKVCEHIQTMVIQLDCWIQIINRKTFFQF